MNIKRYVPMLGLIAAVITIQLLTKFLDVSYYLTQLTMSAYYVMVVLGLCMLMGYAGQISLGQAGFFAIGGYTSAVLTTRNFIEYGASPFVGFMRKIGFFIAGQNSYGDEILYLSPWIACLAAVVVSIAIAYLIGIPVLTLRGHYLAMATLGFGAIVYRIVLGARIFGEADGITSVPGFTLIPGITVSGSFSQRIQNYYIAWFFVAFGVFILTNLIYSRVGRALRSLHGSEDASNSIGINVSRYKLNIFVISAVYAAGAGILLTHFNGSIGPSEASIFKSVRYVAIVAVGGMANLWGVLLMGTLLNFLSLRGVFGTYDDAVFGIILIAIMIFAPEGILRSTILKELRFTLLRKGSKDGTPRGRAAQ